MTNSHRRESISTLALKRIIIIPIAILLNHVYSFFPSQLSRVHTQILLLKLYNDPTWAAAEVKNSFNCHSSIPTINHIIT